MNRFYLFGVVVLLLLGFPLYAQSTWRCGNDGNPSPLTPTTTARSYFGKEHTPKGHLHMLVVYVQFDENSYGQYVNTYLPPANWGYDAQQDSAHKQEMWQYNDLPTIAQHFPGYPAGQNRMFNADLPIGGAGQVHNLSEYYYQQSNGQFQVTADIFPVPVTLSFSDMVALAQTQPFDTAFAPDAFDFYHHVNIAALNWINTHQNLMQGFDWANYDNRTNHPDFESDNSNTPPDGILDYVVFMHRRSAPLDGTIFPGNPEFMNGRAGGLEYPIDGTNCKAGFYGHHTGSAGNIPGWKFTIDCFEKEFFQNIDTETCRNTLHNAPVSPFWKAPQYYGLPIFSFLSEE
ncbi:MAG: hypothetical protein K1X92_05915 [Bacteroidia bacterium]|nr:hypothetical protein [Bacteroidia bacterium]